MRERERERERGGWIKENVELSGNCKKFFFRRSGL